MLDDRVGRGGILLAQDFVREGGHDGVGGGDDDGDDGGGYTMCYIFYGRGGDVCRWDIRDRLAVVVRRIRIIPDRRTGRDAMKRMPRRRRRRRMLMGDERRRSPDRMTMILAGVVVVEADG